MTIEGQRPDNLGYSREQLQHMRAELCGFVVRTQGVLQQDPITHRYDVDIPLVKERGHGALFAVLYQESDVQLIDDVLFYRFVRAANTFRDAQDDLTSRRIAEQELVPYMEYLLNTPRNFEEKAIMDALGYQPLSDGMREEIICMMYDIYKTKRSWRATFSLEYKDYFMRSRNQLLSEFEANPLSGESPEYQRMVNNIARALENLWREPPEDVIREGLLQPEMGHTLEIPGELGEELKKRKKRKDNPPTELKPEEGRLMELLFGLVGDGIPRTRAEAAIILGLTMEEIRKMERKVVKRLRDPSLRSRRQQ